jgi:MrcB-like, N-terminal domain/PD-(D/E)XK nuclease superfamily
VPNPPDSNELQSGLQTILSRYVEARAREKFANHELRHSFERVQAALRDASPCLHRTNLQVRWSMGQGTWAKVPWISFLDDRETTTTQDGVYCVYLFRQDMSGMYITLNQGVTRIIAQEGRTRAHELLRKRAEDLRKLCDGLAGKGFLLDDSIDLRADPGLDIAFQSKIGSEPITRSAAKYADLLKMHAYRDAIRRTAGAYVLYPGSPGSDQKFEGFHEILPGLGAFAIRPNKEGNAEGIETLGRFLDDIVEHLANRTTARERLSYHMAEAYAAREPPVGYGALELPETDLYGKEFRALPTAEDMVLIAWYENDAQLDLARDVEGFIYVRLGRRRGALHVQPNLARSVTS